MEQLHQLDDVIIAQYQILGILGQGGTAITYAAKDLQSGQKVALKVLSLQRMQDFKVLELFEREAQTLKQLNHPAIPRYLDYFQVDEPHTRSFYLVQQLAIGQPLTILIERGWKPDEATVQQIAIQTLEILVYLQQLVPPVIHRDIKPQNLIYSEEGQILLVDFGAVQDTYHNTMTGGSTVVGTYGYMAPEQFCGQAVLSTDLYGLGTTLLFLLTQKPPSELHQRKLKIHFRSGISLSNRFADWLERMIEPVADDRFQSAVEALAVLNGQQAIVPAGHLIRDRPMGSLITLIKEPDQLLVNIPPLWLHKPWIQGLTLLAGTLLAVTYVCLIRLANPMLTAMMMEGLSSVLAFMVYAPFLLLILLLFYPLAGGVIICSSLLIYRFLRSTTSRVHLKMDSNRVQLKRRSFGFLSRTIQIPLDRIKGIKLQAIGPTFQKQCGTVCVLETSEKTYRFGYLLTKSEKVWCN
jgi:eukaryotic-like serine/threonine-protein kinase